LFAGGWVKAVAAPARIAVRCRGDDPPWAHFDEQNQYGLERSIRILKAVYFSGVSNETPGRSVLSSSFLRPGYTRAGTR
jgi:hypothetical protein